MKFKIIDSMNPAGMIEKRNIAAFLHEHLDEYGDTVEDIIKCLDYALQETSVDGGFIVLGMEDEQIVGAVVFNRTGMDGYIPPNVLVYIAVHREYRGKGYGKMLMEKSLELAKGDVKLHVEPENPARFLYEKLGFTNKYLEYRLKRD
ncbi:MAG: GNAT family N-acetyltransferase [Bacteroidales bacterium]|nr:GNAT family N-acetyltransferase [Bacteroidales bacterium]MCF8388451.1 GNAT family N-acetyltransferase [Bacteroidales bacterium]